MNLQSHRNRRVPVTVKIRDGRKPTLKQILRRTQGEKPWLLREYEALLALLRELNRENELRALITKGVILSIAGLLSGYLLLNNPIASPFVAAIGFLIPIWKVKIYAIKYEKHISLQLESALSLITSSYIRSHNLLAATTENLPYLDPLIRNVFESFIAETGVNVNMVTCIQNMSRRISHPIFLEWCTSLVKVYNNSALTEDLIAIVSRLSSVRIIQSNLETESREILSQYLLMLLLLVFTLPLIYLVNYSWFLYFFTHPLGRVAVAFSLGALIYGVNSIIRCSTPIQFS